MRVLVVGIAGAITAPLGAALSQAHAVGENVETNILVRDGGASTDVLQKKGFTVIYNPEGSNVKPFRTDTVHVPRAGYTLVTKNDRQHNPMDYVVLGVKSTELDPETFKPFVGPNTRIVTLQNGIPYWFPALQEAKNNGIDTVVTDPERALYRNFGKQTIGGLTAAAAAPLKDENGSPVPGTIVVRGDFPYTFGNPHGEVDAATESFVRALKAGGLNVGEPKNAEKLAKEVFIKLLGNATLNFIAPIHDATLKQIAAEPHLNQLATAGMEDVKRVAIALGISGADGFDIKKRLEAAGTMTHKTSTHADIYAGKPAEIDGLLYSVINIAERINVATPNLSKLYSEVVVLAHKMGSPYERPHRPAQAIAPMAFTTPEFGVP